MVQLLTEVCHGDMAQLHLPSYSLLMGLTRLWRMPEEGGLSIHLPLYSQWKLMSYASLPAPVH